MNSANPFFERPIVNSPYEYPRQHWELDESGQPTGNLVERRRRAEFITPIPKPKKRKGSPKQEELVLDEGRGLSRLGRHGKDRGRATSCRASGSHDARESYIARDVFRAVGTRAAHQRQAVDRE